MGAPGDSGDVGSTGIDVVVASVASVESIGREWDCVHTGRVTITIRREGSLGVHWKLTNDGDFLFLGLSNWGGDGSGSDFHVPQGAGNDGLVPVGGEVADADAGSAGVEGGRFGERVPAAERAVFDEFEHLALVVGGPLVLLGQADEQGRELADLASLRSRGGHAAAASGGGDGLGGTLAIAGRREGRVASVLGSQEKRLLGRGRERIVGGSGRGGCGGSFGFFLLGQSVPEHAPGHKGNVSTGSLEPAGTGHRTGLDTTELLIIVHVVEDTPLLELVTEDAGLAHGGGQAAGDVVAEDVDELGSGLAAEETRLGDGVGREVLALVLRVHDVLSVVELDVACS